MSCGKGHQVSSSSCNLGPSHMYQGREDDIRKHHCSVGGRRHSMHTQVLVPTKLVTEHSWAMFQTQLRLFDMATGNEPSHMLITLAVHQPPTALRGLIIAAHFHSSQQPWCSILPTCSLHGLLDTSHDQKVCTIFGAFHIGSKSSAWVAKGLLLCL